MQLSCYASKERGREGERERGRGEEGERGGENLTFFSTKIELSDLKARQLI